MPQVPIKRFLDWVPGGPMVVPLLTAAVIVTIFPHISGFFGSFTGALFTGSLPILAVFYVCMGSTIDVRTTPYILKTGGVLFVAKVGVAVVTGILLGHFLGTLPVRGGFFAGLSALAVVAAMNDTNGGLYMALMGQFGRSEDVAAYSIMSIESGPFLTMITLGAAGLSAFPWQTLLGAILPLLVGIVLGNLDHEMRSFLRPAVPVMIPFFGFALGATINLSDLGHAGLLGILLGLFVLVVTGAVLFVANRLTGGNGVGGLAAASSAGNTVAVPAIVASANHAYAPAAAKATVLVAASVVVTAICVPFVTAWWARRATGSAMAERDLMAAAEAPSPPVDAERHGRGDRRSGAGHQPGGQHPGPQEESPRAAR